MKSRPRWLTMAIVCVCFVTTAPSQAEEPTLESLRQKYEERQASVHELRNTKRTEVLNAYQKALDAIRDQAQGKGDLDKLVLVIAEIERFKENRTLPPGKQKLTPETEQVVVAMQRQMDELQRERMMSLLTLGHRYDEALDALQRDLTRQGKLDDALAIREERVRVAKELEAVAPTVSARAGTGQTRQATPPEPPAAPSTKGPIFLWPDAQHSAAEPFVFEGRARLGFSNWIALRGGRAVIKDRADALLKACKDSNTLQLDMEIVAQDLNQKGPARIITFSSSPHSRNFTLGQELDKLILRLRTTKTGPNGMNPEVTVGTIEAGRSTRLRIVYTPGRLVCHVNGQKTVDTGAVQGDFSNWEPQHLLLGQEWDGSREWQGTIRSLSIQASTP